MLIISTAPTCTVGPSRPMVKPPKIPRKETPILPAMIFRDSSLGARCERNSPCSPSAAITCGIPLPSAPGKKRRVSQTHKALMAGVRISGSHSWPRCTLRNMAKPKSVSHAYITATRPTNTAPSQRMPYCIQSRRTRRKVWPCRPASILIIASVPDCQPVCAPESSQFVHVFLAFHDLRNQLAVQGRRQQFDEGVDIAAQVGALLERHA